MQMGYYWNFLFSIYARNVLFSRSIPPTSRSLTKLLTANSWRLLEFSITDHLVYERPRWKVVFRGAAKIAGENVEVVNIEHGSREGEGSGKTRRKIHSLRWPGENKREKGNRGKKKRSRGWWFRILSVVVACSPSGGWVMCTVHAINLICRVEKLSELNPATMGRRRKRVVNSIRCRHTRIQPPPSVCLSTFLRGFNIPPLPDSSGALVIFVRISRPG